MRLEVWILLTAFVSAVLVVNQCVKKVEKQRLSELNLFQQCERNNYHHIVLKMQLLGHLYRERPQDEDSSVSRKTLLLRDLPR